jgi:hypothetical protein
MTFLSLRAATPPMGWNSFDCFNASVREHEVRANAEIVAQRLAPFGWQYIVVDFCWSHPHPKLELSPDLEILSDGCVSPDLVLDGYSRQLPALNRFPSAANGQGFKPLGDYIHSLGLGFGIHIMRGIPRQAVEQNLPIVGGLCASDIAQRESTCTWLNHMYGVDMSKPGAQSYYNSLFELYAKWGVDYIKVDDIAYPYHAQEIEAVQKAIEHCGRPMTLSLSPGPAPLESAAHLRKYANLWRISADFWDSWEQLKKQFTLCRDWTPHITPGHWPDADMLPLGRLSVRGPQAESRWTRFTQPEQYALMSLFAIFRSPLMIGSDLSATDDFTFTLLTNPEVLSVNQHALNPRVLFMDDCRAAWVADTLLSNAKYLALFNLDDHEAWVTTRLSELELPSANSYQIRDLWQRCNLPVHREDDFSPKLPAHGGSLYRITALPSP